MSDDQQNRRRITLIADENERIDLGAYTVAAGQVQTAAADLAYVAGGVTTINAAAAEVQTATAAAGPTTWEFSGAPAAGQVGSVTLELTNGGSQTQTWPAALKWPGGSAPALTAAGRDVLTFWTRDAGATWSGMVAGKAFA